MNPVTLNLVAIAIFLFTMSSLLGPLVHLSPWIPATVTFGVLLLATVDTLGWQGQLGTLIVDWLAARSPEQRQRIVHHEAGHFLVAYLVGVPVTGYALSAWEAFRQGQPGQGGVRFEVPELHPGVAALPQLIDRYCTIWMAGIAAETLIYGQSLGGADDRDRLRLLWSQLQRPGHEAGQKERWATLQAKTLLDTHTEAYTALVAAMTERASVETCYQILADHCLISQSAKAA